MSRSRPERGQRLAHPVGDSSTTAGDCERSLRSACVTIAASVESALRAVKFARRTGRRSTGRGLIAPGSRPDRRGEHPAPTAAYGQRRRGRRRTAGIVADPPLGVATLSRTRMTSSARWGRSSGRFSRRRVTRFASNGGRSGRRGASGAGGSIAWAISTACAEARGNGCSPVSSSYAIAPNE